MKSKTVFICASCGHQSPKWEGKCAVCSEWNTYVEETVTKETSVEKKKQRNVPDASGVSKSVLLEEIPAQKEIRISLNDKELHRTLG